MSRRNAKPRVAAGLGQSNSTDSANNTVPTPGPQHHRFVVVERKECGREIVIGGPYDDEATASSVVRLFAWAGAVARIERAP
jgi:hypothetical protein